MRPAVVQPEITVCLAAAARQERNYAVAADATIRPQKCAAQIPPYVPLGMTACPAAVVLAARFVAEVVANAMTRTRTFAARRTILYGPARQVRRVAVPAVATIQAQKYAAQIPPHVPRVTTA